MLPNDHSMYKRILNLPKLLQKKSHFLFGPRATGKSWLIRHQLADAQVFDLLNTATYDRLLRRPSSLAEEITKQLVVIDEVQKLPRLLDEVHRLIEEKQIRFLLTGSSARKLKHGGANLLAGRARSLHMFPLTTQEHDEFSVERYCNLGGLPLINLSDDPWLDLREYVHLYLKEEIVAEAIVRKVDHFARFLDVVGICSGQEINYHAISSDAGVPPRTVANYIEVLIDTMLAFELTPFQKTRNRKAVTKSKIYIFDVGVANFLAGRKELLPRSEAFDQAFEHFLIQEIRAYIGYNQLDLPLTYWRTVRPQYEVDCIVGDQLAIEIKSSKRFHKKMLAGLIELKKEKKVRRHLLISRDPVQREVDGIGVMPLEIFIDALWNGELIS